MQVEIIRKPVIQDGAAVYYLVEESTLDLNSPYAYLMLFQWFSETCAVAEAEGEVSGFVAGFRPPQQPDTLFIWQVGVRASHRGGGLATQMLLSLLRRPSSEDIHHLEATVSPSNIASLTLFRRIAARLGVACEERTCFAREHFPGGKHEEELLIHIGPFATRQALGPTEI